MKTPPVHQNELLGTTLILLVYSQLVNDNYFHLEKNEK